MPWLPPIHTHVQRLLDSDAIESDAGRPRWWRTLRYAARLGRLVARKLGEDRAQEKAAALTYHTLFSLLPTIVLMLVVAKAFVGKAELEAMKDETVQWVTRFVQAEEVAEQVESETPAAAPFGLFGHPVAAQIEAARIAARTASAAADRRSELQEVLGSLDQRLTAVLNYLESVDVRSISIVGVLLFIYGATQLLATIERNLNAILHARDNRSLRLRLPLYFTTITLAPVVLGAGRYAQQQFSRLLSSTDYTSWIASIAANFWPLITTWLVLLLMYRLLPNARVHTRAAAIGSFVAALILSAATYGFGLYASSAAVSNLYGALTLLPLGLLLVWLLWLIVLFGFELAVCIQFLPREITIDQRRRAAEAAAGVKHEIQLVEPRQLLRLMRFARERFDAGQPFDIDDVIEHLHLPPDAGNGMLAALTGAGLLLETGAGDEPAYALARPADRIDVPLLLAITRGMTGVPADDPALEPLRRAEDAAAEGRTLAEL